MDVLINEQTNLIFPLLFKYTYVYIDLYKQKLWRMW